MLTVVSIMKNEFDYILEWVAYYLVVGANNLIVFDNGSTDGTKELLQSLEHIGAIRLIDWSNPPPAASPQISAYNHALKNIKLDPWVAFIDTDEFIVPLKVDTIMEAVTEIDGCNNRKIGAIAVNWKTFGSSGKKIKQEGLVTERFLLAAPNSQRPNNCFKTIAKTGFIKEMHIHVADLENSLYVNDLGEKAEIYGGGMTKQVTHTHLQINHYMVKSVEEYTLKKTRGNANYPEGHSFKYNRFDDEYFRTYDVNGERDETILRFRTKLLAKMDALQASIKHWSNFPPFKVD